MADPKRTPAIPAAAWPTSTFTGKDKKLFFNGEGVHIIHERPRTPTATASCSSVAPT